MTCCPQCKIRCCNTGQANYCDECDIFVGKYGQCWRELDGYEIVWDLDSDDGKTRGTTFEDCHYTYVVELSGTRTRRTRTIMRLNKLAFADVKTKEELERLLILQ